MLSLLLAIAFAVATTPSAWAALVCGDVTAVNSFTPSDPTTIPYTTPSGSNQVLFVGVTTRGAPPGNGTMKHAGISMTAVTPQAVQSPIGTTLYYLANPTSGTNNVVHDYTSGSRLSNSLVIFTCSGADTSNPIRAFNTGIGTGTAVSVTVSGVQSGDIVVDMFGSDVATTTPTIGANQTAFSRGNDGGELAWGSSQQAGSDGGGMSWTTALSEQWAIVAAAIRPAATVTSTSRHAIAPVEIN